MIAAYDDNRLIGSGRGIPWQLPRDSEHFRAYTVGKAMLLGRRTFEEMIGWFTSQRPIVLTRDSDFIPYKGERAQEIEAAIELARCGGAEELVVSGGAQIYALALPVADELLITEVHGSFEGEAFFPVIPPDDWEEISRERFPADAENSHAMSFVRYRRR